MHTLIRLLIIVSFVLISRQAIADQICASTPDGRSAALRLLQEVQWSGNAKPLPLLEEFKKHFGLLPYATSDTQPEEKRFSWWGYRHQELHDRKVVQELLQKSHPTNCCSGTASGECRVTRYLTNGVGKRKVIIDDLECDITDDTKIVQLDTFHEHDKVVVCAGKTDFGKARSIERVCPKTYCIGGGRNGT